MSIDTLGDVIRLNSRQYPDKVAFICGTKQQTFSQFNTRVNRLVDALRSRGMKKGDRLGILSSNQLELVEAFGAAEKGGFIAVPANARLEAPEIAYIFRDAEVSAIIAEDCHERLIDGFDDAEGFVFSPENPSGSSYETLVSSGRDVEPDYQVDGSDPVYMMYTGGTTGKPKGVLLDHLGQMMNARINLIEIQVDRDDTLMTVMPLNHIGGKTFAISHFHRGTTNVLVPRFDAAEVLATLVRHQVRCTLLAPTMVQMLLEHLGDRPFTAGALKTVYYSSAPMPVPLLKRAIAKFGQVFMQFYGLTESGPSATALHKADHMPNGTEREQEHLAAAGRPMIYSEVEVVDDLGEPVRMGEVGEVRIRGPQVMRGYWRNPAATAETLRGGWVYSGDYGRIDENGYVFIVGRKKDVIISGGENIYPREIEEHLAAHPCIKEVAVVGSRDEKWGEAVTAVIVLKDAATLSEGDVIEYCRSRIASFKKPRRVHFWPTLPRSSLGKIMKSEIRNMLDSAAD